MQYKYIYTYQVKARRNIEKKWKNQVHKYKKTNNKNNKISKSTRKSEICIL